MENNFSVGDTVSFNWNGFKMNAFILNEIHIYSQPMRMPDYRLPKVRIDYVVEMNFRRTSIRDDFGNIIKNGLCKETPDKLSTCRMVLIEKTMKIFSDYVNEHITVQENL